MLQPRGADRKLPGLVPLLRRGGAELVAHRPERRAVVRLPAGSPHAVEYAKVVRPGVLADVARTAAAAAALPLRTPTVVGVDDVTHAVITAACRAGPCTTCSPRPTRPPRAGPPGRPWLELHRTPVPDGLRRHDDEDERAVVRRWQHLAEVHGLPPAFPVPDADPGADEAPAAGRATALLHRDFHDKQVVVDDDGALGLLDFDLMAVGPPALDLANILVHLDLRVRQGLVADAAPLRSAVLEGYQPGEDQLAELPRRERATWQRLAAVYAFRPLRSAT